MTFRAILFDLDGTLVDSERESAEAMARVLSRELGLDVTAAHRNYVVGHSWNEIYARLKEDFGDRLSWSMRELIDRAAAEREHVIAELGLTHMPGAVAAVRRFCSYPKAIVTGSSRAEARQALGALGIADAFPVILASEDYARGKPAPDGYLAAAAKLGAAPADCLVIEDSAAGIAAARAAGMTVVAVSAGNFLGQDQSAAHHVVETLDEVTDDLVARLGGPHRAPPDGGAASARSRPPKGGRR
ncbi:MAG TPA: HAD family phosphatase [Haliangiales bacterium]|nr:HAD family phosphatase [Haliangiales bacterium]